MAKKIGTPALEFVFDSAALKPLVEKGATVKFTVYVEPATTKQNEQVGVLRIKAHAQNSGGKKILSASPSGGSASGGPCPPCIPPPEGK